jgi:Mg-chelatase subunit ChlD
VTRLAILAAAAALVVPASAAASPSTGSTEMTGVSAPSRSVVRVSVRATGDLTPGDIEASLGGKLAFVDAVRPIGRQRPLHLVVAIDTSGSMRGQPIAAAIRAAGRLVDAVGTNGQVGLVAFSSRAEVVQPLTGDARAVRDALASLQLGNGTAL